MRSERKSTRTIHICLNRLRAVTGSESGAD
jgi:hypothetical protein